jgi:hypothetical protein
MKNLALSLLLLAPLAGACHDDGDAMGAGREPDEYVGCAADENWPTFDEVSDIVSDADAPKLTAPALAVALPSSPPDFTWDVSPTISGTPNGDVANTCEQFNTGFATLHLPPVSGTIYDLQLLVGNEAQHRVITTLQKWKASQTVWSTLAGKTVTIKLRRMTLLQNDRKEGPFIATSNPSFTVTP